MARTQQLSFLNEPADAHGPIVNVASVPQRSPFRYPGGKTWLVPRIRTWMDSRNTPPEEFVEPFAGGAIVSLTVAFEYLANHVTMVELDECVAAVWLVILEGDAEQLAERIATFEMTLDTLDAELKVKPCTRQLLAFQTILRNRVNHGGILAPGSGKLKHGENGKGVGSRWYPETLKRRILDIIQVRDRIRFIAGDGFEVLRQMAHRQDAVFFIDPPYTAGGKRAGSRLYRHYEIDHESLFKLASELTGDFLMTYDNAPELHVLARRYGFDTMIVAMKNTHHAEMTELLIGRNLEWARQPAAIPQI
jgi:DNA adenine methylase